MSLINAIREKSGQSPVAKPVNSQEIIYINNFGAHGELRLTRVDKIPGSVTLKPVLPHNGRLIVGHSESGHHHYFEDTGNVAAYDTESEYVTYLEIKNDGGVLWHNRSYDTHGPQHYGAGTYRISRGREYIGESFRPVID